MDDISGHIDVNGTFAIGFTGTRFWPRGLQSSLVHLEFPRLCSQKGNLVRRGSFVRFPDRLLLAGMGILWGLSIIVKKSKFLRISTINKAKAASKIIISSF